MAGKVRALRAAPERRGEYRVKAEFVAQVAMTGSDDLAEEGEVVDLSTGGARLLAGLDLDIGQRVSISFGAPRAAVNLAGTVRHVVGKPKGRKAYGLAWDAIPDQDLGRLQDILLECLAQDATAGAEILVEAAKQGEASLEFQLASARGLMSQLQGMLLLATREKVHLYNAQEVALGLRACLEAMAALLAPAQP